MYQNSYITPVGPLIAVFDDAGALHALGFHFGPRYPLAPLPDAIRAALDAYFAGDPAGLRTITLKAAGTAFQRRVWDALSKIPLGETRTYGQIAAAIGKPTASRAVGMANGRNPISVFVPCHRVIGASGALTGYAGGVERKRWLLDHEARMRGLPRQA